MSRNLKKLLKSGKKFNEINEAKGDKQTLRGQEYGLTEYSLTAFRAGFITSLLVLISERRPVLLPFCVNLLLRSAESSGSAFI